MQQVRDADGVVISLFLCFFKLHLFFVLGNQDTCTSSLQSALECEEEDDTLLTAKDGTKWKKVQVGEQSTGRLASHNILKECPGSSSYARKNIQAGSPASAWLLFIDKFILEHIRTCTITEAHRQTGNEEFSLTNNELLAFIAVMYTRGVTGSNDMPYYTLWTENWGVPLCKKAISRNPFSEILRFLRFDTKSDRSQRLKTDIFALFSVVWNRFIDNCISCYTPGAFITVDEQLFPSKCRCPFTQFMASKPDKYGQKYWLAVYKDSKYVVNGFPYVGRDETRSRDERVSVQVVMRLLKLYLNKGRNVTTDNYFTSMKLATDLQKCKTSLLGTVNRIRKEVPAVVKHMKEPLYSTTLYKSGDVTMTVYQGKARKNVVLFSTLHQNITIAENAKKTSESVKAYNDTKYGVDIVDQMARKYSVKTSTRRWPIHSFQNTLDLAAINAWIAYKEVTKNNIPRRVFL